MSSSPPDTLGQYQIIREIARSNDIVYEGYDPAMNRRVAVKELAFPGGSSDQQRQDRIKRFLREAKAAGSLVHPNIVTVYNVAEQDGRFYLAMEYLDGQTLRKRLESGTIDQEEAIEIAIEILKALAFAHANGVVHRDVKPENIQILEGGAIKLTDFGIARLTFEPNITMDGQVFGTPSYMSPEQINGRDIDPRSDIFSLGIVLYEMLTGNKPFRGDSVVAITHAIMNFDPPHATNLNHTVWSVVSKALEKSPPLRQSSAEEMIAELKQALKSLSSPVLDPVVPPALLTPPPVPPNPYASYGTPHPQTPAAPQQYQYGTVPAQPGQTIYAPYTGTPGPAYPPYGQPPGSYNPPAQIPVYYPPPPRKVSIDPAIFATLGRFMLVLLVIGAMIGLLIFVVNALGQAGSRFADGSRPPAMNPAQAIVPPVNSSPSASNYPPPSANVDSLVSYAVQRVRRGGEQSSIALRTEDWREANDLFTEAISASAARTDEIKLTAYREYRSLAEEFEQRGQREPARAAIYQALAFAPPSARAELQAWIDRLNS